MQPLTVSRLARTGSIPVGDPNDKDTGMTARRKELTAKIEPFDSFWEGPEDVEKGYRSFGQFYRVNYLKHVPADRNAKPVDKFKEENIHWEMW